MRLDQKNMQQMVIGTGDPSQVVLAHNDMPSIVRIEITNTCNLACPHCRHHSVEKRKPENYNAFYKKAIGMTKEQIDSILEEIAPYKVSLTINGANEPTIAENFTYLVRKIKQHGLPGTFNTNGVTLNEELAQLLVDVQFDSVTISIDALTPETLKKARGISYLDKLVKNVETLIRVRGDHPLPRIGVTFVETDYNSHEIPGFLEFWKKKVDFIRVTGYILDKTPDVERIPGTKRSEMPPRIPCKQLFRDIVIRANGDVSPCVIVSEDPNVVVGNIFRDGGVKAVWNSSVLQKMRDLHNNKKWDEIPECKKCDYWLETYDMQEEERDGFLVRSPSPYSTFYNVINKLGNWNRNIHDRQGRD